MFDPPSQANEKKEGESNSFQSRAPAISLPKGGGAIRGMGEKFAANPVTGTGSISVPIATSPGRSGFGPQLSLSYDSGAGNGPFGFGWNLSIPAITRKTDKGLPKYQDADESDVFILSGAEDLVPLLVETGGQWQRGTLPTRTVDGKTYRIQHYRPRIEGLFARIERWTNETDSADTFWRSISKDNITTWYGKTIESRIFDPADLTRTFSWLICESYDDKGNVIAYGYEEENSDDIDPTQANERNRVRTANRYLKRIRYGNHQPYLPELSADQPWPTPPAKDKWFFEVVFDYGEHDLNTPIPEESGKIWPRRNDPFSSYRAGFEVRTYRLCQRVLMFHHFPDEADVRANCLVRSTDFTYSYEQDPQNAQNPIFSFLRSVTQTGYKRKDDDGYLPKSLPPLEFKYSRVPTPDQLAQQPIQEIDPESLENLPYGLDNGRYQWIDLDGEGLSGILTEQADGWFYKRNLSPINTRHENGRETIAARFAPIERVAQKPSLAAISSGRQQLLDLAGDGQVDLVELEGPTPGFFERTEDERWEAFVPFTSLPNLGWDNPNLKFVDLTGDGHADILISEDEVFCWHPSLAEAGFAPPERVRKALDEEKGPKLVLADDTQSIYLSDISGDGLTDLVRIRNGEVCYWPNLGYGRFGAKVTMDNAPWFDRPDLFDQRRIRLADIDGSGVTDILYLSGRGVQVYFNQSGNSWSAPTHLTSVPATDNVKSVTVVDLLGNGTACLVWSSPLSSDVRQPMRYLDLMGGQKPHLLIKEVNNLGAETHVQYAPSTKFYLADKLAGKPWITRLPFPVHVVERVETFDAISQNRFVTRYAYHHGYFDGPEREFRGFGMVEQRDTEEMAALTADGTLPEAANIDETSHVPPVLTCTWFHTGAFVDESRISKQFEHEYYREGDTSESLTGLTDEQLRALLLDDTLLPSTLRLADGTRTPYTLSTEEVLEACRALKGAILRQEIYALDGTAEADRPYSTSERNYTIELLQPRDSNKHAVFFTHAREQVDFHYERALVDVNGQKHADPRVSHAMTLEVDAFGNVLRSVAIGYRRRDLPGVGAPEQKQTHLTLTVNRFANRPDEQDWYRIGLPVETRTYEIVKSPEPTITDTRIDLFRFEPIATLMTGLFPLDQLEPGAAKLWPYEKWDWRINTLNAPTDTRLRLIEHVRTVNRKDDLTAFLPLGVVEPLALPGESYKLALTPGLLAHVFRRKRAGQPDEDLLPIPAPLLEGKGADQGGYIAIDGSWWIASGRAFFDPDADIANPASTATQELSTARQHFYLPRKVADPFGHSSVVDYDAHDLLVTRTSDALGNTVTAANDYRVLQPRLMSDPNRNRTAAAFDALGMVVATAVMGKEGENLGDLLEDFDPDPPLAALQAFVADPRGHAASLLGKATTRIVYDLDRYQRCGQPPFATTMARETHFADPGGALTKIQVSFSYSDGFGREIQKKIQAERGDAPQRGPNITLPSGDVRPGALVRDANGKPVLADTPQRWVGSGRTVFNNKGKPVRQYEPFFSSTHLYEEEGEMTDTGVSPILFYDPVERIVATLHPNHTWEKVVFDPWQQTTYDVNDTVTRNPKTDNDVKGFFTRLPDAEYLPTWHEARKNSEQGPEEKAAADKAAFHADTPTVAHFDALGRTFLTIAHNRFERSNAIVEEKYPTRLVLDIEGNQREVIDAQNRVVMRYDHDIAGPEKDEDTATNRIHQASMEAGERWMLKDVAGKPIRTWDSRSFLRRMTYDALRRPTRLYVTENGAERLAERTVYGEGQGDAKNHRTRMHQVFDGAGIVTSVDYDFKGNLREGRRDLLPTYKLAVDWLQNPAANDGSFTSRTTYDALNRPLTATSPDGSVYRPTFNEANLLDKVDVNLRGAGAATPFVANINYDAKGQRELIAYGNGALTAYKYDPLTFRLIKLTTTRPANPDATASQLFQNATVVQDLRYTYDPAGNITRIEDAALKTIIHNGEQVKPVCEYIYDAIYRLIEAKGREHIGQTAHDFNPPNGSRRDYPFLGLRAHPNDAQAMRNYTEGYEYDAVGNFEIMRHIANGGAWTRGYAYNEASLIESAKKNNRLSSTTVGNNNPPPERYVYDAHGNMRRMPHLGGPHPDPNMHWDYRDQLRQTDLGGGGTAYYVYDAAGQRVRKVWEKAANLIEERIYLGGFEIFRRHGGPIGTNTATLQRETLHLMDDKQRIAVVETRTHPAPQQLIRYQFSNHLGSASLELNDQAQIISYEEYTPYGSSSYQAVRSQTETPKRYRYTGKERDEESGLYYYGARYYASWLGRWMSCDPIAIPGGIDLYTYVNNAPENYVDPDGTHPVLIAIGLIALFSLRHDEPGGSDIRPVLALTGVGAIIAGASYGAEFGYSAATYGETNDQVQVLSSQGNTGPQSEVALRQLEQRTESLKDSMLSAAAGGLGTAAFSPSSVKTVSPNTGSQKTAPFQNTGGTVIVDDPALARLASEIPPAKPIAQLPAGADAHSPGAALTPKIDPSKLAISPKQAKHQIGQREKGLPNYDPTRSILTADPESLKPLVGSGTQVGSVPVGAPGSQEAVSSSGQIGHVLPNPKDITPKEGTFYAAPTTRAKIHYSKDDIHFVPAPPTPPPHKP